jgi:hypothetical protein
VVHRRGRISRSPQRLFCYIVFPRGPGCREQPAFVWQRDPQSLSRIIASYPYTTLGSHIINSMDRGKMNREWRHIPSQHPVTPLAGRVQTFMAEMRLRVHDDASTVFPVRSRSPNASGWLAPTNQKVHDGAEKLGRSLHVGSLWRCKNDRIRPATGCCSYGADQAVSTLQPSGQRPITNGL